MVVIGLAAPASLPTSAGARRKIATEVSIKEVAPSGELQGALTTQRKACTANRAVLVHKNGAAIGSAATDSQGAWTFASGAPAVTGDVFVAVARRALIVRPAKKLLCDLGSSTFTVGTTNTSPPPTATPITVDASGLSPEARRLVVEYNERAYGAITRWTSYPIRVWADASFPPDDLQQAVDVWNTTLGDTGLRLESTTDHGAAHIRFTQGALPPGAPAGSCGSEGPTLITNHVISEGSGVYSSEPRCSPNGEWQIGLAHGIGHILGLGGHTASGSDLMGSPNSVWGVSDPLRDAMRFIYNSPPGARVL